MCNAHELTHTRFRLIPFRSPLLGKSRFFLSFLELLRCFSSLRCLPRPMHSVVDDGTLLPPGSPIRVPPDQCLLGSSPGSFAACYALHRLLVPRHPPCTLISLTTIFFYKDCWSAHHDIGVQFEALDAAVPYYSVAKERFTKPEAYRTTCFASREFFQFPSREAGTRPDPKNHTVVEVTGFEPVTSWLQTRRSPTELHPRQHSRVAGPKVVGPGRFELPASALSGLRSNQLSYGPVQLRPEELGTPRSLDRPDVRRDRPEPTSSGPFAR